MLVTRENLKGQERSAARARQLGSVSGSLDFDKLLQSAPAPPVEPLVVSKMDSLYRLAVAQLDCVVDPLPFSSRIPSEREPDGRPIGAGELDIDEIHA